MIEHSSSALRCVWSPSGEYLATVSLDFSVVVWNTMTETRERATIKSNSCEMQYCNKSNRDP